MVNRGLGRVAAAVSIVAIALAILSNGIVGQDNDIQDTAIKQYEEYRRRGTLGDRVLGMHRLRVSPDEKTLEILIERYDRVTEPKEPERYLIAQFVTAYWTNKGFDQRLGEWMSRRRSDVDYWLWFRMASAEKGEGVQELVRKTASDARADWKMRALCLRAMAGHKDRKALEIANQVMDAGLPLRGMMREIAYEEILLVLEAFKADAKRDVEEVRLPWFKLVRVMIEEFPESPKPTRASLAAARILSRVLDSPAVSLSRDYWRRFVNEEEFGKGETDRTAIRRPPAAKFAGVETSGNRIAFAIDLSDSMLKKLTAVEKASAAILLREVLYPYTDKRDDSKPKDGNANSGKPSDPEDSNAPDEAAKDRSDNAAKSQDIELPPHETRLDLAKALLAASLRKLDPSQEFIVIGFGFEAKVFGKSKRFESATVRAVEAVLAELNLVSAVDSPTGWGVAEGTRPDGLLWGFTNLHGALLLACRSTKGALISSLELGDAKLFENGCDTIFLFSDGAPTWSEYTETRRSVEGERYRDLESGRDIGPAGEKVTIIGPYRQRSLAVADMLRMALLRKIQVNTFGMGEADDQCLKSLAAATHGTAKFLVPTVNDAPKPSADVLGEE